MIATNPEFLTLPVVYKMGAGHIFPHNHHSATFRSHFGILAFFPDTALSETAIHQ